MLSLREFLYHILDEVNYVLKHTANLTENNFLEDETLTRAVVRSLEIIGEAVKNLPEDFKVKYSQVNWKSYAGLRDRLIHHYFGVDYGIVWDVVKNEAPALKEKISKIIEVLRK